MHSDRDELARTLEESVGSTGPDLYDHEWQQIAGTVLASDWLARRDAAVEAGILRFAASTPDARLSGHSGVSVRWLRDTARALANPIPSPAQPGAAMTTDTTGAGA